MAPARDSLALESLITGAAMTELLRWQNGGEPVNFYSTGYHGSTARQ